MLRGEECIYTHSKHSLEIITNKRTSLQALTVRADQMIK